MSLHSLGIKYKTDKATHGYLNSYDVALSALKDLLIKFYSIFLNSFPNNHYQK